MGSGLVGQRPHWTKSGETRGSSNFLQTGNVTLGKSHSLSGLGFCFLLSDIPQQLIIFEKAAKGLFSTP